MFAASKHVELTRFVSKKNLRVKVFIAKRWMKRKKQSEKKFIKV